MLCVAFAQDTNICILHSVYIFNSGCLPPVVPAPYIFLIRCTEMIIMCGRFTLYAFRKYPLCDRFSLSICALVDMVAVE